MNYTFLLETTEGNIVLETTRSLILLEPLQRPLIYNTKGLISVQTFNAVVKFK